MLILLINQLSYNKCIHAVLSKASKAVLSKANKTKVLHLSTANIMFYYRCIFFLIFLCFKLVLTHYQTTKF